MITLVCRDFVDLKSKNGLFLFTLRNSCGLCTRAVLEISNYDKSGSNFPHIIEVACETEDELFSLDLMVVPVFRLYKNGEMVWQKGGILYEKQIKEMLEIYGK
jgi:hypothetical protein